jgi:hypothetical protein
MFLSGKETIFFILTFVVIFVFSKGAEILESRAKLENPIALLITSLIGSLILLLVYKFGKIHKCQSDGFHFEVTPAKQCQGFPYLQTSDPKLYEYCENLFSTPEGRKEYAMVNCTTPGFVGRPVHFSRTPMSNDKWENEMCKPPYINLNDPCVL